MQNILEKNAVHPVKVLIVEDSSDDVLLIIDALRSDGFEPSWKQVATRVETRLALKNQSWDLVIADHRLPGFSALEAFQIYLDSVLDIPFIIVSGFISEEEVVTAMKAGVHDYIGKGSLARLAPAVIRELREAQTRRERKRAEYALRAVHEELATIYANAPVALLVVDEELRVRKSNEMAARFAERDIFDMVGLRPGSALGCQNSFENAKGCGYGRGCVHCTLRMAAFDTLRNGTRHSDIEKNMSVVRDGETRLICLLFSIVPLWVDNTKSALICAQDITRIKQANAEIESQHEQLRRQAELIDFSHDAVITTDAERRITGWNTGAVELYGWTAEEARGQMIHQLLHSKKEALGAGGTGADSPNKHWDGELTHIAKDGQTRVVESRRISAHDRIGKPSGLLEINRDVTERKKTERELCIANRDLDRRVKELRAASEQKSVLIKEVQHRVKNNLQIVSSMLALEAERFEDSSVQRALQESRDRVRSMALIHEKFSHSEDLAHINFDEYVEKLAGHLVQSYAVDPDAIQLSADVTVTLDMHDAIACGLILQELLSNSMKHAFPNGSGKIRIDFHESDGMMEMCYRDTGVGLGKAVDLGNPESLGLQLINDLAGQLKGALQYRYAAGAVFLLSFPSVRTDRTVESPACKTGFPADREVCCQD